MKKLSTYIFAAALCVSAAAQEIKCGGFSPATIRPDETSTYSIILEGASGSLNPESIPMPKELRIVGTNSSRRFSFVNGRSSSSTTLEFTVAAEREGEWTVPQWTIEYDSKKYTIAPATLKVDKNAPAQSRRAPRASAFSPFDDEDEDFGLPAFARHIRNVQQNQIRRTQQARQQQQESLGKLSQNISLKLEFDKKRIFVGEAVPCKLVFSYNRKLDAEGFKLAKLFPQANKSDAFDCTLIDDKYTTRTNEPDKISVVYDILITPLKAGMYNLDFNAKGVFLQEVRIDDFFMPFGNTAQIPFETSTADQKLEIQPLPENGKPASFNGAIGKFTVSAERLEPDSISVGEPTILSVDITGIGSFARVNAPKIADSPDWKTYKPKASFTDESNSMGYVGIKTFKYTIVPTKPDLQHAPALEFSYFDPQDERYTTLKIDGAAISVAPSGASKPEQPEAEKTPAPQSGFDKIIDARAANDGSELFDEPSFWAAQILILAAVATFVYLRVKRRRIESDPVYAKKLRNKKAAEKFLKSALKAAKNSDVTRYLENARKALQNALASTSDDCESDAVLAAQAREIMRSRGFGESEISAAETIFAGVDAVAYGGLDAASIDAEKSAATLKNICNKLR